MIKQEINTENSFERQYSKKTLGHKTMLKNNKLIIEIFEVWRKEKDKLKVISFLSEKYSLLLSRDQLDSLIRKGNKLRKTEDSIPDLSNNNSNTETNSL